MFISCLFKGSQEQSFFQTLLFTAFLATVLKILTYAFVSTWSSVSSGWEHVKRKMHPCVTKNKSLPFQRRLLYIHPLSRLLVVTTSSFRYSPLHLTPPLPPLLNMFLVSRFTIRNLHCLLGLVISYFHNKTFQNCSPVLFWKWVQFESFISFTASVPEGLAKSDISNLGNKLCVLGT